VALHSDTLLDHFQNPRNVGKLAPPAVTVEVSNPACGDQLVLAASFVEDRVAEVRYQVRGCTAAIAAGSALTEWMLGKSRPELTEITPQVIEDALGGLQPASKHVAILCADGVKRLLSALS
jgi:nitrogen fixation protein NifU and related proteins